MIPTLLALDLCILMGRALRAYDQHFENGGRRLPHTATTQECEA